MKILYILHVDNDVLTTYQEYDMQCWIE
uniref:Uncharacterized protein n=1 Tax=Arundo donax TaxID=35708 RepID=A0A0A9ASJ9_ARUDO